MAMEYLEKLSGLILKLNIEKGLDYRIEVNICSPERLFTRINGEGVDRRKIRSI